MMTDRRTKLLDILSAKSSQDDGAIWMIDPYADFHEADYD
jgi:hypothetical protein